MSELFNTSRLCITDTKSYLTLNDQQYFLEQVVEILSKQVVEQLPESFHHIYSLNEAKCWFDRMNNECRVLIVVLNKTSFIVGFIFVYECDKNEANIGYLLKASYWKQGLAKEMLTGFLNWNDLTGKYNNLLAGVSLKNMASSNLLLNIGFSKVSNNDATVFYEYTRNACD
ncbi:GNAT family N-acetyltransferase [Marinicellulosiphila megalodicopiae]|uniref:GNAT family N-acetyltransferase n=1 Tax=Marinicellulosiphila megalodicopiae TaxID=2724896 RepID=UPI003BAEFAD2